MRAYRFWRLHNALCLVIALTWASFSVAADFTAGRPDGQRVEQRVQTPYGDITPAPVIQGLLNSPAMHRIQHIDQSGPSHYFGHVPKYTRYEHCLGVFALLHRFERPLSEQAAGLLHDTSHTVFSHTGDLLFQQADAKHSYQDTIHLWFLEKMQVPALIADHGITLSDLDPENGHNLALEQDLPDMCADRIEYNLHTGLLFNQITEEDFSAILNDLHFEKNRWFFNEPEIAARFANLSLHFTQHLWGAPWNNVMNQYFAEILAEAIRLKLLDTNHIHFGTDEAVLEILKEAKSPYIQTRLQACRDIQNAYQILPADAKTHDAQFMPKFRGIDPWVHTPQGFQRLTAINPAFKARYLAVQQWAQRGMKIKYLLGTQSSLPSARS